jgi:hypothetical protein
LTILNTAGSRTAGYFRAAKDYLETQGKPAAFYSNKHGIFRVNVKDAIGGDHVTQFGRVLSELNIDIICANGPQAKGRLERVFGTLQDRLVKEVRLAGIATNANQRTPGCRHLWPITTRGLRATRRTPKIYTAS